MSENVVRMDAKERTGVELESLSTSLSVLNWELQAQTIITATGLPVGDLLTDKKTFVPSGSLASRLGHTNLESFICGPKESNGLGWAWKKWEQFATAIRYKNFYSIYVEDPVEIIAQFNDICKVLKREPVNAAEYHSAKDSHLIAQRKTIIEQHEIEKTDLSKRAQLAEKLLSESNDKVSNLQQSMVDLEKNHNKQVLEFDLKINEARRESNLEKEKALLEQRGIIEAEWQQKLDMIKDTAEIQVSEAQESSNQLREYYNSDNFVPVSKLEEANQMYLSEKNVVGDLLIRLTESQKNERMLQSDNDEKTIRIINLEKTIDEQAILIDALHKNINSGADISGLSVGEIGELKDKIAALEGYIERYRASSKKWKNKHSDAHAKVKLMKSQIKDLNKKLDKASSQKGYESFAAWFFGITTVALTVFSVFNYVS